MVYKNKASKEFVLCITSCSEVLNSDKSLIKRLSGERRCMNCVREKRIWSKKIRCSRGSGKANGENYSNMWRRASRCTSWLVSQLFSDIPEFMFEDLYNYWFNSISKETKQEKELLRQFPSPAIPFLSSS